MVSKTAQAGQDVMQKARQLLKSVFGYEQFRPMQHEIITDVLSKKNTLAVMPTGGGKSLCYQIPALIFPGLTVVVSPLISLMKDQVQQLAQWGVPAIVLNSSLEWEDYRENMARVRRGEVRLLYAAPETLLTDRLQGLLSQVQVDCLTIDEAHCISEWGHDFRPEYRQLAALKARFPEAVLLALTATATPRVQEDIQTSLGFQSMNAHVASFNRENLFLEVQPKQDPTAQTINFIRQFPKQSGIIYCFSRQQVEDLAAALGRQHFSVKPYHAGLPDEIRRQNQDLFIQDDVRIIVATVAFGMGIHKPNVRFVLHYDLPKNIESYYQEIGRAGRDGLPAHCLLLYGYGDTHKIEYFIEQKEEPERSHARQHLQQLSAYAESKGCRRTKLLAYFGERFNIKNCGQCDNCRAPQGKTVDLSAAAEKFLRCVERSGERFGAAHIVDILLGVETEKIERFGHYRLPVFGTGKDYGREEWLALSRQLLDQGLLERDEKYFGLHLTSKGSQALQKGSSVWGNSLHSNRSRIETIPAPQRPAFVAPEPPSAPPPMVAVMQYDEQLFDRLCMLRKTLAEKNGVPPYTILPDRTLMEIAAKKPDTLEVLKTVHGIGETRLERYGPLLLELVKRHAKTKSRTGR